MKNNITNFLDGQLILLNEFGWSSEFELFFTKESKAKLVDCSFCNGTGKKFDWVYGHTVNCPDCINGEREEYRFFEIIEGWETTNFIDEDPEYWSRSEEII